LGTLYQLKGSIGLSAPGSNFGSASFISHRSLINNYPLTGMQADIAVNIPDLVAGTVHASIFSTANVSFNTYLQTHSKPARRWAVHPLESLSVTVRRIPSASRSRSAT
jgi:hypothetical protein